MGLWHVIPFKWTEETQPMSQEEVLLVPGLIFKQMLVSLFPKRTTLDEKRRTGSTNPGTDGRRRDQRRDRWRRGKGNHQQFRLYSFLCIYSPSTNTVISSQCFQGKGPYYPFPHLRVKLQRDPKDRSVSGKVQYTLARFVPLTLLQALRRERRGFKDACITS